MSDWIKCGLAATMVVFLGLSLTSIANYGLVNTLKYMPWGIAALMGIPASIALTIVFYKVS